VRYAKGHHLQRRKTPKSPAMPSFRSNPRELADKIRAVLEMSEEQREEFRRRAMEARSPELFVGCGDGRV
jgi:hypothetical protein